MQWADEPLPQASPPTHYLDIVCKSAARRYSSCQLLLVTLIRYYPLPAVGSEQCSKMSNKGAQDNCKPSMPTQQRRVSCDSVPACAQVTRPKVDVQDLADQARRIMDPERTQWQDDFTVVKYVRRGERSYEAKVELRHDSTCMRH